MSTSATPWYNQCKFDKFLTGVRKIIVGSKLLLRELLKILKSTVRATLKTKKFYSKSNLKVDDILLFNLDEKLQFEKDKNAKAAERVRQECQDRVNSAAATIKTYFIKQMESKDAQIYQLRSKIKELETCTSQERESKDKLKESQSRLDMVILHVVCYMD